MRHGFLLVDKPTGPTSHDIVHAVRNQLHEKDMGHIGTLDPAASGLLVLAVGAKALKVIEFFQKLGKEYIADVRFGAVSSTYDNEGTIEKVEPKPGWTVPDQIQVRRLIEERFIGDIKQVPPAHSAVHVNGQRAYDLARKGAEVKIEPRTIRIDECEIVSYEYPDLQLRVSCGSGTYIRSLAHDLGDMLRCGGYLSALRRTKVGDWDVNDAIDPMKATWTDVTPLKDVLKTLPSIEISAEEWEHVKHGRSIDTSIESDSFAWFEGLPVAVLTSVNGKTRPRKVL